MSERKNEAKWLEKYQRWQINVQRDGVKPFTAKHPAPKVKLTPKSRPING